jgi:hypothetical protein
VGVAAAYLKPRYVALEKIGEFGVLSDEVWRQYSFGCAFDQHSCISEKQIAMRDFYIACDEPSRFVVSAEGIRDIYDAGRRDLIIGSRDSSEITQ